MTNKDRKGVWERAVRSTGHAADDRHDGRLLRLILYASYICVIRFRPNTTLYGSSPYRPKSDMSMDKEAKREFDIFCASALQHPRYTSVDAIMNVLEQ